MAKPKVETVYVQIPFCGFIAPINVYGPLKSFIPKSQIIDLVQRGYEVKILNPSVCEEFAKQLEEYRALVRAKKIQEARNFADNMLNIKRNPVTAAIEEANAKIAETKTPVSNIPGQSPIDTAIANAKATEEMLKKQLGGNHGGNKNLANQLNTINANPVGDTGEQPNVEGTGAAIVDNFQDQDTFTDGIPIPPLS